MWILTKPSAHAGEETILVAGKDYVVGRKNCDVVITGDQSISRRHAIIKVTHPVSDIGHVDRIPQLTICDQSKFGTCVCNKKLETKTESRLKHGDVIKFGTGSVLYRVEYKPYIVLTSCLKSGAKKSVKSIVADLGGHITSEWTNQCDILVMGELSVTHKVVCALISQKYIVTPQYLVELLKSYKSGATSHPAPENFLPDLTESQITANTVDFNPVPARNTLFEGKTIIFLTESQYKKLKGAIKLAGGIPVYIDSMSEDNDELMTLPHSIVLDPPLDATCSDNLQSTLTHVRNLMAQKRRRLIPDQELVFAVLYCSLEQNCNPLVNVDGTPIADLSQTVNDSATGNRPAAAASAANDSMVGGARIAGGLCIADTLATVDDTSTLDALSLDVTGDDKDDQDTSYTNNNNQMKIEKKTPGKRKLTERDEPTAKRHKITDRHVSGESARTLPNNAETTNSSKKNKSKQTAASQRISAADIKQEPCTPRANKQQQVTNTTQNSETQLQESSNTGATQPGQNQNARSQKQMERSQKQMERSQNPSERSQIETDQGQEKQTTLGLFTSNTRYDSEEEEDSDDDVFAAVARKAKARLQAQKAQAEKSTKAKQSSPPKRRSPRKQPGAIRQSPPPSLTSPPMFDSVPTQHTVATPIINDTRLDNSRATRATRHLGTDRESGESSGLGRGGDDDRSRDEREVSEDNEEVTLFDDDDGEENDDSERDVKPVIADLQVATVHHAPPPPVQQDGFMTTRTTAGSTSRSETQDTQPGVVKLRYRSLVVEKPQRKTTHQRSNQTNGTSGNSCMWNGKLVKNFKKFRKVGPLNGTAGLPLIIGGTDLIPHQADTHHPEFTRRRLSRYEQNFSQESNASQGMHDDEFTYVPQT